MKLITLFFTLSLSVLSNASELKKTLDGGVAKCDELADVGSRAFRLTILTETQTSTSRELDMNLELLKCVKTSSGFELQSSFADEVINKLAYVSGRGFVNVKSTLISLNIDALSQDGKLLTHGRILELSQGKYLLSLKDIDIKAPDAIISSMFVESFELQGSNNPQEIESQGGSYLLKFN